MPVAANADDYANARLNIFFPGVTPDLDGQCVSLVKWFMGEMTSIPDWNAARGDARYVGHTLVNQGHAVEVPYGEHRRGDIITYEYGLYGHIGVVLSGDRTFEENVNWPGVASKVVAGARVYASRIGRLDESWRHDQHIYRIKSYNEKGVNMTPQNVIIDRNMAQKMAVLGGFTTPDKEREPEFYASIEGHQFFDGADILMRAPDWGRLFKSDSNSVAQQKIEQIKKIIG